MSKSSGLIIVLPIILLSLIMQVYGLWGWLSRDGWIQYFLMAEVYALMLITLLYIRSILKLHNPWIYGTFVLFMPAFFIIFRQMETAVGSMVSSLWYINIIISVISSTWLVVFIFGISWLFRALVKQKVQNKTFIAYASLISLSVLLTYIIKSSQLPIEIILQIWEADKLRTVWFMLEPIIVLSFSLMSIYFYLVDKSMKELKHEYAFMGLFTLSILFEYMTNGFSLVTLRTLIYFMGLYSFINLIKNERRVNYFLVFLFMSLVGLHLNYYSASPAFFTYPSFFDFLHNSLIESIKMFMAIYIFVIGWINIKDNKFEFRLIMVLVTIIAYTYTTQSQGAGVHLYDIVAITAMLKITASFLIVLYGFYYFRDEKTSISKYK